MAQLCEGLRLDLTDALTGELVAVADVGESAGLVAAVESESHRQHVTLSRREPRQDGSQRVLVESGGGTIERGLGLGVGQQVTELAVPVLTGRCGQRQEVGRVDLRCLDSMRIEAGVFRELLDGRLAVEVGAQPLRARARPPRSGRGRGRAP